MTVTLWWVPAGILLAGLVPLTALVRGALLEARRLGVAVAELRNLQPALIELRTDLRSTREGARELDRRIRG